MKKIKEILSSNYDKKRIMFRDHLVDKMGKVEEKENEIICYVDKKRTSNNHFYCHGINDADRVIAKIFKLNKQVHYIIQDMELNDNRIVVFGYDDCIVTIKNCTFKKGLRVYVNGTCNIENCHIVQLDNKLDISSKELNVKNMNIKNECSALGEEYNIIFNGENELDINGSDIGDLNTNVLLSSSNGDLNIINSKIISDNVTCKGINIIPGEKTVIDARNILNVHSENIPEVCIMPAVTYNDSEVEKEYFKKVKNNKNKKS